MTYLLNRQALAAAGVDQQTIEALAKAKRSAEQADSTLAILTTAPMVMLGTNEALPNGRTLSPGAGLRQEDGGAGGLVQLSLTDTAVRPGAYGSAQSLVRVTVDRHGRVAAIEAVDLVSDNVTEGSQNLYYTDERARAAISSGAGINYDAPTGEVAVDPGIVAMPEYGTWTPTDASGAGLTFATGSAGRYAKIGRLVWVTATIIYPATGSADPAVIGGLPLAGANDPDVYIAAPALTNAGITFGANIRQVADIRCYFRDDTNTAITNTQLSGKFVIITFSYLAS